MSKLNKSILNKFSLTLQVLICLVFVFSSLLPSLVSARALTPEEIALLNKNILYVNKDCEVPGVGAVGSGTGTPAGTTFPDLDPGVMADVIDKFIDKENPDSKLKNLGETIVAGAENSNINPFLIVAQAYMESGLADPSDYNVSHGNNAFGRSATSSQPNFQGAMLWYKWSSVKASVDHTAHENRNATGGGDIASYLREQFGDILDREDVDLDAYIGEYAPDGNEGTYVQNISGWVKEMAEMVGAAGPATTGGDINTVYMRGDSITAGADKYYKIEKKFQDEGIDATVTGSGGGTVLTAGPNNSSQDGDLLSGLAAVERDKNIIKNVDAFVVAYGTNNYLGSKSAMETEIKKMVNKIRSINDSATIFWVNIKITNSGGMQKVNNAIRDMSSRLDYTVIDYASSNIPLGDDFHPAFSEAGFGKWGQLVVDKVASGSTTAPEDASADACCADDEGGGSTILPGGSTEEKIWNFLVTPLPEGLGLNDKQAAGIMGNLEQESGFDPTVINGIGAVGIAQWTNPPYSNRRPALQRLADTMGGRETDLDVQLAFIKQELMGNPTSETGGYEASTYNPIKASDNLAEITRVWLERYEVPCLPGPACDGEMAIRLPNAQHWLNEFGGGGGGVTSGGGSSGCGGMAPEADANMQETTVDDSEAKFITMPSKYSCPGHTTRIDSRVAADLAYIISKYNMCANDGLADGHNSHGAGISVDLVPKDGNSKEVWKNTTEAAARAIGWFGDSATDPIGSKRGCAFYDGDYGQCMHIIYPDKFPKWMRWMGYNGDTCHGDPWHYQNACSPHLHISWDSPNTASAVSPTAIAEPIHSVYVFPVPVPDDIAELIN